MNNDWEDFLVGFIGIPETDFEKIKTLDLVEIQQKFDLDIFKILFKYNRTNRISKLDCINIGKFFSDLNRLLDLRSDFSSISHFDDCLFLHKGINNLGYPKTMLEVAEIWIDYSLDEAFSWKVVPSNLFKNNNILNNPLLVTLIV